MNKESIRIHVRSHRNTESKLCTWFPVALSRTSCPVNERSRRACHGLSWTVFWCTLLETGGDVAHVMFCHGQFFTAPFWKLGGSVAHVMFCHDFSWQTNWFLQSRLSSKGYCMAKRPSHRKKGYANKRHHTSRFHGWQLGYTHIHIYNIV